MVHVRHRGADETAIPEAVPESRVQLLVPMIVLVDTLDSVSFADTVLAQVPDVTHGLARTI